MTNIHSDAFTTNIIISTLLLFTFTTCIILIIFHYQKRRLLHRNEMLVAHENFTRTLLQSSLESREQALDHISKELHSNINQLLSFINMRLIVIINEGPEHLRESLSEVKAVTIQVIEEIKQLSIGLNNDHVKQIGFLDAFKEELKIVEKSLKCHVIINAPTDRIYINPNSEIILFRLCQEILNNVIKYANPTIITVTLVKNIEYLTLSISDNGIGFNVHQAFAESAERKSTGLTNMSKRAALINGTFTVTSEEGIGTTACIKIPKSI